MPVLRVCPFSTICIGSLPVQKGVLCFLPMKKKIKKETNTLRCELQDYQQQGVSLWLDGQPSTPKTIAKACKIAEEGTYMRDYIQNEEGEVEHIQFNLIKTR